MASYQAPLSLGFSRQEHWSGLPFPSPMHERWKVKMKSLIHVQLLATSWTAAYQAPPSMGFSRQESWSGVPLPCPWHSWDYLSNKISICVCKVIQSCLTLCNTMDCSPPGSSVHGISQARILEWVAVSFSWRSSQPRDRTRIFYVSCIGRRVLNHCAT